jgi:hypothetical protein
MVGGDMNKRGIAILCIAKGEQALEEYKKYGSHKPGHGVDNKSS